MIHSQELTIRSDQFGKPVHKFRLVFELIQTLEIGIAEVIVDVFSEERNDKILYERNVVVRGFCLHNSE